MKTSNKLLLGIFCTIILLTTAVQLMVYAKYKRGEYVKFNREEFSPMSSLQISTVRFISITGMGNVSIIPGDTSKLEVPKENATRLTYRVISDTLFIKGDSTHNTDDLERGDRNYSHVNVYLSATVQINATHSNLRLGGAADSASAPSYNIYLDKSSYLGILDRGNYKKDLYFTQIHIEGGESTIEMHEQTVVNSLHAKLINSKIDDKGAVIRNLTIDADPKSTVTLSGKNIKSLK